MSSVLSTTTGIDEAARSIDETAGFSVNADDSSASTGTALSAAARIITNPSVDKVYRWLAEEHTTISPVVGDTEFFSDVPGSQGVLIKTGAGTVSATATPSPTPDLTPVVNNAPVAGSGITATVAADGQVQITLTGTDADIADVLDFIIVALPTFGSLFDSGTVSAGQTLAGDTVWYFAASSPVTGTDTFTFSVTDGTDTSAAETVTVTIQ